MLRFWIYSSAHPIERGHNRIEKVERTAQGKRCGVDSLGGEAKHTQVFRFGKEMADGWYAKCLLQIISKRRAIVCDFSWSHKQGNLLEWQYIPKQQWEVQMALKGWTSSGKISPLETIKTERRYIAWLRKPLKTTDLQRLEATIKKRIYTEKDAEKLLDC